MANGQVSEPEDFMGWTDKHIATKEKELADLKAARELLSKTPGLEKAIRLVAKGELSGNY